jgi:hypothetical protein
VRKSFSIKKTETAMKNILRLIAMMMVLAGGISCQNQFVDTPPEEVECDCKDELYYYAYISNGGEKAWLDDRLVNDWLLVGFERQVKNSEIVEYIEQTGLFKPVDESKILRADVNDNGYIYNLLWVNLREQKTCSQLKEIIRKLKESPAVMMAELSFFVYPEAPKRSSAMMASGYFFYVKVKDKDNLSDLYALMQETNTRIIHPFETMPEWFLLSTNKHSKNNALQMANYFYETGKFAAIDYSYLYSEKISLIEPWL